MKIDISFTLIGRRIAAVSVSLRISTEIADVCVAFRRSMNGTTAIFSTSTLGISTLSSSIAIIAGLIVSGAIVSRTGTTVSTNSSDG